MEEGNGMRITPPRLVVKECLGQRSNRKKQVSHICHDPLGLCCEATHLTLEAYTVNIGRKSCARTLRTRKKALCAWTPQSAINFLLTDCSTCCFIPPEGVFYFNHKEHTCSKISQYKFFKASRGYQESEGAVCVWPNASQHNKFTRYGKKLHSSAFSLSPLQFGVRAQAGRILTCWANSSAK